MDQYKALGRRFVAWIIDSILLTAAAAALYFALAEERAAIEAGLAPGESTRVYANFGDYALSGSKGPLFFGGLALLWILYYVVLVGTTGRTAGKALTGVRVVRENDLDAAPGMGRAFVRQLLWIVDGLVGGLVGFIVALTNPKRKRIGDMAAGTVVVQTNKLQAAEPPRMGTQAMPAIPVSAPQPPPLPTPPSGPPADWYPDPHGKKRLRYWDGTTWTDHTAD